MTVDLARLVAVNVLYVGIGAAVLVVSGLVRSRAALVAWAPLAPLIGMAIFGVAGSILVLLGLSVGTALAAVALAAGVAAAVAVRRRREERDARRPATPAWLVPALAVFAAALPVFVVRQLVDWDAWAIWAVKAKALALLGAVDASFFANRAYQGSQVDYPLLLPTLEAAVWPASAEPALLLHLQMWLIGAAGLLALWSVLTLYASARAVALALLVLVTAPAFTAQLMTGYADVPLAIFSAVALALLAGWLLRPQPVLLPLAALFLGAAALSKNEGLFVIVAAALAVLATGLVTSRVRAFAPALGATAAAACLALPWQLYVVRHDLRTGLYETSALADPAELAERADRLGPSLSALLQTLASPLEWALVAPLFALLVAVAFVSGSRPIAVFGSMWATGLVAQLLLAYWIANTPLDWHLATSEKRVVAPLAVGMAALAPLLVAARADDDAAAATPRSASGRAP